MAEELCLYRVELVKSAVAYVVARGPNAAEAVAKANADDASDMEAWEVHVEEAEPKLISPEWQASLPYAPDGVPEISVAGWVERMTARKETSHGR